MSLEHQESGNAEIGMELGNTDSEPVSFADSEDTKDDMALAIEEMVEDLVELTDEARVSEQFTEWLETQSRFHTYSWRNTMLIQMQKPGASQVAGFWAWKNKFNRSVKKGEKGIYIWRPIITDKCPDCGNAPNYGSHESCEANPDNSDEWNEGVVGFTTTTVFDVSQTEGEPLPELDSDARGDVDGLFNTVRDVASDRGYTVRVVSEDEWSHGTAKGVCKQSMMGGNPVLLIRERDRAAMTGTLIHEFTHAEHHMDATYSTPEERRKEEVEAEATAYVVGRHFGLEMENKAFYLASWAGEDTGVIRDRLKNISNTAKDLINAVENRE